MPLFNDPLIINDHILEMGATESVFGNFKIPMEVANARAGKLITTSTPGFERSSKFFDFEWFDSFNTDFFSRDDTVLWAGSCIVQDFASLFEKKGWTTNRVLRYGQGVFNMKTLAMNLRWLFENESLYEDDIWEDYNPKQFKLGKRDRAFLQEKMLDFNKVVLFSGTTDIYHDKVTGKDLHAAPPLAYLDPERHIVRRLSHQEVFDSHKEVLELIHKHICKDVLFILSPFGFASQSWSGDHPPLPLSMVAKASIRVAVEETMQQNYFPMYEMIQEYFTEYRDKGLHIHNDIIQIMIEVLGTWYGDFKHARTKSEVMADFQVIRKAFVQRALVNKSLPKEEVYTPKTTRSKDVPF
jgi:hypothetical protein|tara:strand:- start:14525 stop:15586 length:1062 start_codon:yes stop_codon:yes gene_type:complete